MDYNSAVDLRSRAADKVKITSPAQNDNIKDLSESKDYITLPLRSTDCVNDSCPSCVIHYVLDPHLGTDQNKRKAHHYVA